MMQRQTLGPTMAFLFLLLATCSIAAPSKDSSPSWPDRRFTVGPLLFQDDFTDAKLLNWLPELESGGTVASQKGHLTIDVPRGGTVWFRSELSGPVMIEYQVTMIGKSGPNDRVSDLNCFWMAQYPAHPDHLLDTPRTGKFSDYDTLRTYYVGLGGNGNTTTRFRRYIGQAGDRPLLPENDLSGSEFLLRPNVTQTLRVVACDGLIQYYRDNRRLFEMQDPAPYTYGWFGLRTTQSHLEVQHFRVYRLLPRQKNSG